MPAEAEWPPGRALTREGLEPRLLDRLREVCSPAALPLRRTRTSLRVGFQDPRFGRASHPHAEVDRERERSAADAVRETRAERLKVHDVDGLVTVPPRGSA